MRHTKSTAILLSVFFIVFANAAFSQAAVEPWGNMKGIRTDGELMQFESGIDVVNTGWSKITSTGKERQRPKYRRENNKQTVTTRIDSLYLVQQIEDMEKGVTRVHVQFVSKKDTMLEGLFFHIKLRAEDYSEAAIESSSPGQSTKASNKMASVEKDLVLNNNNLSLMAVNRQIEISFDHPVNFIIKKSRDRNGAFIIVFIQLTEGGFKNGQSGEQIFTLKASGKIDRSPVTVQLNTAETGPAFAGFGGNFRLQNPRTDPQVIDYCLANMRVAWGRVEMPWQLWQPFKDSSAIDAAKAGKLNNHVKKSMEMAQRLSKMGMPVILSAWSAPRWAVVGDIGSGPRPNGVWGNPLDTANTQAIYKSITDYIIYLKDMYGVEIKLFSFNESDLGINIRQTGEEHAQLIKGLGAYFESNGLKTKMLLGDNSDATTWPFIYPAMNDAATHRYIGAISFHSWRGCDSVTLQKWRAAAKQMKLPLIVGEGSIDAAAWNYPLIFEEQTYAMEEIDLYIRLLAICKPLSILQWQLTADYSPLSGGGIFGNNEPLRPTQRFWNLKQLASVPEDLSAVDVTVDKPHITCAVQGNSATGKYAIHFVNSGAARMATIKGLPKKIKWMHLFLTNKTQHMQQSQKVAVSNGQARVSLSEMSYVTLISE